MTIPRIMIAGTSSGVGKTTITLGIMAALTQQGYSVQPFKVGPDYIDPSYHTLVTGNSSINLDANLTSPQIIKENFFRYSLDKEIAIIEGVMGLFDGPKGDSNQGSSAEVAEMLSCPVVLVIDAKSMARSAAAVAMGFVNFDPKLKIAGLIINNIGSERHKRLLESAFKEVPVPVLGYLKRDERLKLTERHLGLIPAVEKEDMVNRADFAKEIANQLDLKEFIKIAGNAPVMDNSLPSNRELSISKEKAKVRIAVAKDAAFNFYYWDGLAHLEELGAELVWFSPLADHSLPADIGGIIIGGGFPELFLEQLAANQHLHQEIKEAFANEMPIYAECGGYMYLCKSIVSFTGKYFSMVGIVPCNAVMGKRLAGMGYRKGYLTQSCVLGEPDLEITGHEFHYSNLTDLPENFSWALELYNPRKEKWVSEGYTGKNLLASYLHIHWRGSTDLAKNFIVQCQQYRESKV